MRLLLIYTGGTIGMVPSDGGWRPQPGYLETRIREHLRQMAFEAELDWLEYDPLIDSSQVEPVHWNQLAQDIVNRHNDYDGFVILHGTDTMAYTSAALAFMLQNTHKPVVLTGSQIPVWEAHTDGLDNVMLALQQAMRGVGSNPAANGDNQNDALHDVYLAFDHKLYHGAHVTKINSDRLKAFSAPHGVHLHSRQEKAGLPHAITVDPVTIDVYHCLPGNSLAGLEALIDTAPRALILKTFGSGNAPDTQAMRDLLARARDQGTLLINASQCYRANVDMERYEAAAALRESRVLGARTMTLEALFAKLQILCTQHDDNRTIADALLTPWTQELPPPKP